MSATVTNVPPAKGVVETTTQVPRQACFRNIPNIDGLRALSVAAIIARHVSPDLMSERFTTTYPTPSSALLSVAGTLLPDTDP